MFIRRSLNEFTLPSPQMSPRQPSVVNEQSNEITGASLRGTAGDNNTFKGLAKGTKRNQGWFYFSQGGQSNDPIRRVVLAESPIDAMSFAVLDRNDSRRTLYLSTDGAGQIPTEFLQQSKEVVVAYDNDKPGIEMAQRVKSQLPNAVLITPSSVDWNQELVNMFDWSKQSQSINRQPQRGHERDTGLSL